VASSASVKNDPVKIYKDAMLAGCVPLPWDLVVSTDFILSATNKDERNEGSTLPVTLRHGKNAHDCW
jgi:hypothetical protein